MNVKISRKVTAESANEVLALYYQVFQNKFRPVFMKFSYMRNILLDSLEPNNCFIALQGQQLLGVATIEIKDKHFINVNGSAFIRQNAL